MTSRNGSPASRAAAMAGRLARGFGRLTLDPSPRLRRMRAKPDVEERAAETETETAKAGLIAAAILTLAAFAASVVFFALGNQIAGVALVAIPVVMLVASRAHGK